MSCTVEWAENPPPRPPLPKGDEGGFPVLEAAHGGLVHSSADAQTVRGFEFRDRNVLKAHANLAGGFIPRTWRENSNRISAPKERRT